MDAVKNNSDLPLVSFNDARGRDACHLINVEITLTIDQHEDDKFKTFVREMQRPRWELNPILDQHALREKCVSDSKFKPSGKVMCIATKLRL